jgi:hypothetical protein
MRAAGSTTVERLARLPVVLLLQLGLLLTSVPATIGLTVSGAGDPPLPCVGGCAGETPEPVGIRWDEV